jgi:hypothetical protein
MDFDPKSLFARLTFFAGLFFASSMPAIGGDEGGAGGGGDEGGGDGGDGGGDEGAGDEGEVETGDEGDESVDEGDEGDESVDEGDADEGDEEDVDGEGKPKKLDVQKALDKLRKKDRELASVLRKEHFTNQDFRKAFASPTEAQAASDLLNLVGGEEGISTLQSKADDFAAELQMVADGNPQILDDIVRDSPDGFKKLMNAGVEKLRLLDQGAYERLTAKPLLNALREKGVINTLEMIKQMAVAGKGQEVFDLTQKLLNWTGAVEQFANRVAEERPAASDKAIDAKLQKAEALTRRTYEREVGTASNRVTGTEINRHLKPLIRDAAKRGVKLSKEQLQDVESGVYTEISASLKSNSGYQRQMAAYYAKNADPDDIAAYVRGKVESLAEAAAKKVWGRKGWAIARGRVRTGGASGNGKSGAGAGSGSGTSIFVSKPPEPQNVDWSKDPQRSRWMGDGKRGEATLKTGKVVRFRWDT